MLRTTIALAVALALVASFPAHAQNISEDFSGERGARPAGWTAINAPDPAQWTMRDGLLSVGDSGGLGGYSYLVLDSARLGGVTDYSITAKAWMTAPSGRIIVVARWQDAATCYEVSLEAMIDGTRRLRLDRVLGGSRTTLKVYEGSDLPSFSGLTIASAPAIVGVTLAGTKITCTVNSRTFIEHTDDVPLRSGTIGLGSFEGAVFFDDVLVTSPSAMPAAAPSGSSEEYYILLDQNMPASAVDALAKDLKDAKVADAYRVDDAAMGTMVVIGPFDSRQKAMLQQAGMEDQGFYPRDIIKGLAGDKKEITPPSTSDAYQQTAAAAFGGQQTNPAFGQPARQPAGQPAGAPTFGGQPQQPGARPGFPAPLQAGPSVPVPGSSEKMIKKYYSVRVTSLAKPVDADDVKKAVESHGYIDVKIYPEDGLYNVYVGEYDSIADGENVMAQLAGDGYRSAAVYQLAMEVTAPRRDQVSAYAQQHNLTPSQAQDLMALVMTDWEQRVRSGVGVDTESVKTTIDATVKEAFDRMSEDIYGEANQIVEAVKSDVETIKEERKTEREINDALAALRNEAILARDRDDLDGLTRLFDRMKQVDEKHANTTQVGVILRDMQVKREDRHRAKEQLDQLIPQAQREMNQENWSAALSMWNGILAFPYPDLVTPQISNEAKEGQRMAKEKLAILAQEQAKNWSWTRVMIWVIVGVVSLLALWFFWYHATTKKRVVKIMEEALPDLSLPALEFAGGEGALGIEGRQAGGMLALPDAPGSGASQPATARGPMRAPTGPSLTPMPSGLSPSPMAAAPAAAAGAASGAASRRGSAAEAAAGRGASALKPSTAPAPKAPDLSPTPSPGDEDPVAAAPKRPAAAAPRSEQKTAILPSIERPATTPPAKAPAAPTAADLFGKPKEGDARPKLDLAGLPDLPDFDGIAGGAGGGGSAPRGSSAGPGLDLSSLPTKMEFESVDQPGPAAASGKLSAASSDSSVLDKLEGFNVGMAGAGAAAAPSASMSTRPMASATMDEETLFEQTFGGDEIGAAPANWEGAFDFASLAVVDAAPYGGDANRPAKCLKYEKTAGAGQVYYYCQFPSARGTVSVEFDVCCTEKNRYLLGFYIEKDKDFRRSIHTVVHCANPRQKASLRLQGTPAPYDLGHWAHVKFEIDMRHNTLTAFVDGEKVLDKETVDAMPDSINTLAIRDNHPTTGVLLLSNIRVQKISENGSGA